MRNDIFAKVFISLLRTEVTFKNRSFMDFSPHHSSIAEKQYKKNDHFKSP